MKILQADGSDIQNLSLEFPIYKGAVKALNGVRFRWSVAKSWASWANPARASRSPP